MSIRIRLTLWYSCLLATMLLVFGVSIYFFINWNSYQDYKDHLQRQINSIKGISPEFDFWNRLSFSIITDSSFDDKEMYYQYVNYKEGFIAASKTLIGLNTSIPYPSASSDPKDQFKKVMVEVGGENYEMLTYQKRIDSNGELVGLVQLGVFTYNEHKYLHDLRTILFTSSLAVVLLAFTVGLFLARQALRPIERVITATKQIDKGSDLSVRIPNTGPRDEIGILVETLNGMLSRIERAYNELDELYKAQRRFVSDASHELRTPLTTIRGNIDLLEKVWSQAKERSGLSGSDSVLPIQLEHWEMSHEAMEDISAEAKRMSRLVNDLLSLARADAGYYMEKSQIELKPLVDDVARRASLLPRNAEWKVGSLEALEGVYVTGNHDYLQQLLFIFIENAFKYTEEGYIELSAKSGQNQIGLTVKDTGIGMNTEDVPHIFDRFYRADLSRGVTVGTGLGLSIAKWIIDEHNGSVEVVTRPNGGSAFTVWLPIAFPETTSSTIIEGID